MSAIAAPAPVLKDVLEACGGPGRVGALRAPAALDRLLPAAGSAARAGRLGRRRHGRGRGVVLDRSRARRDAAEVLRQPARGRLPVVRAHVPGRRVPARGERDARRQGRARDGRRAPAGVPDADGAELRAGALAARRRRQGSPVPAAAQAARSARTACRSACNDGARRGRPAPGRADLRGVLRLRARGAVERARARAVAADGDPASARARSADAASSQKRLRVRVSYVKVAEFQRRGALHFHCVLRLDAIDDDGEVEAPPARYGTQLLIDAATAAARHVSVPSRSRRSRRSAGARRSRCASSTRRGRGVVRGLHREVRDEVDRGGRRADVPARGRATSSG